MSSTQSIIRNFDDLVRCSSVLTEGIESGKNQTYIIKVIEVMWFANLGQPSWRNSTFEGNLSQEIILP